ncbi:dermonecrotic toxin domain-containing protein [Pseudomonas shirazensis]|uniref:dermonecrotic toxin domain-containing protein n=1 Tax=Pseudomonas shirazensis TaxID=2745494 RepID=UPI003D28927D
MTTAANTSTELNSAYHLIASKTPNWLGKASPAVHSALRNALANPPAWLAKAGLQQPAIVKALAEQHALLQNAAAEVAQLFQHLPGLEQFARQQLSDALKQQLELDVDVSATYLLDVRPLSADPAVDSASAYRQATRSLLQYALRNFEASAALPGGMDNEQALLKKSVILDYKGFMGTVPIHNALELLPERFAQLCRTLDIGGQYQALLQAIYYDSADTRSSNPDTYAKLAQVQRCNFTQSLHLAYLKGDISEALYKSALAAPLDQPLPAAPLTFSVVSLWDVQLTDLRLLHFAAEGAAPVVALYIPADPQTPLQQFPSLAACEASLRDRLLADIGYLDHCLPERNKALIQQKLLDRLQPLKLSVRGTYERTPDPQAQLHLQTRPLTGSLLQGLVTERVFRHEQDAAFHAMPTAIIDVISAVRHREHLLAQSLTALNVAGFFIPVLGEVMMGVCALQLSYEVYEGIESWQHDDREKAHAYLMDVVENVALMAAFAAGSHVVGSGLGAAVGKPGAGLVTEPPVEPSPVDTPSWIEELETVEVEAGQLRLWRPDLTPYAQDISLPAELEADALGLYQHDGRSWLRLPDQTFAVSRSATDAQFRIQHPRRPSAYAPPLRHNGAGAWLHGLDRPREWQGLELFRRLGHLSASFDDISALRILQITDSDQAALRRILSENQRLPAALEDSMVRFNLDRQLRATLTEPGALRAEFAKQYRQHWPSQSQGAAVIAQQYPQLPVPIIEELLRHASAEEAVGLTSGKIPRRLAEEIRVYQQQVRLNRAYEGLYLHSVRNWDSDRLILRSLQQLPGWPADLALRLEQRITSPLSADSIGPQDAQQPITVVSAAAGYLYLDPADNTAPQVHSSLYGALLQALPVALQESLSSAGITDARRLREFIQQAPLMPRQTLREMLAMQAVRPGYRSPMRLADGRLGYTLGGRGGPAAGFTRHALLRMVRLTGLPERTAWSADQILNHLQDSGMNRADINALLQRLLDQRSTLRSRLDDWHASHTGTSAEADAMTRLADQFMQHWHDSALPTLAGESPVLRLQAVNLASFPDNLPEFFGASVTQLQLIEPGFGNTSGWTVHERQLINLFCQFPQLRTLEISRPYSAQAAPSQLLFGISLIGQHFPALESLSVINQNLPLSGVDIESLANLSQLRRLDLSGNRLSSRYQADFSVLTLDFLGLERMLFDHWPEGLSQNALVQLGELSLRDNQIRTLPSYLLGDEPGSGPATTILLQGNPLVEEQLLRVMLNQDQMSSRIEADLSPALSNRLQEHTQRRQALSDALDNWSNASSSTAPLEPAVMIARYRLDAAINAFWRSQELGLTRTTLRLANTDISHFPPQLPAFFYERVRNLSLSRMSGSTAQLDSFFSRFPQLESLRIVEHVQASPDLPTAFLRLPELSYLSIRDMGLEVDEHMLATIAQLTRLTVLELAGNRLAAIAEAPPGLRNLRRLELNNMGIQQWPSWVDGVLPLELLDLSENQLTELPEHILSNLDNDFPVSSISLFDNPLTHDTMFRARTSSESQRSFTFAMDVPEDLLLVTSSDDELAGGHLHNPVLPIAGDEPRLSAWLLGSALQNEALEDAWQQLQQAGDAQHLLAMVGRLQQAAPYRNGSTRVAFSQRIRKVLVAAVVSADNRLLLNAVAQEALVDPATGNQTCHDGALLIFQNLELLIDQQRLLTEAADSEQSLYSELRRLYRLQRLDEIARGNAKGRDEAEVRLAYRRGLNHELKLGVPNDNMLYEAFADVSRDELALTVDRVQRDERSEAFIDYAVANSEWQRYLRVTHAERFAAIEAHYQEQVLALPDQFPDRPLEQLTVEYQALADDKQARERLLVRELTILANPDRS